MSPSTARQGIAQQCTRGGTSRYDPQKEYEAQPDAPMQAAEDQPVIVDYTPVGVNAETLKLMHEIDRVFTKYPFFGSRQIAAYLPQSGFAAGRHRVRRLMGIMGLQAHLQRAEHP